MFIHLLFCSVTNLSYCSLAVALMYAFVFILFVSFFMEPYSGREVTDFSPLFVTSDLIIPAVHSVMKKCLSIFSAVLVPSWCTLYTVPTLHQIT